ncbi:unnamed protein product, partial [Linum tenue]
LLYYLSFPFLFSFSFFLAFDFSGRVQEKSALLDFKSSVSDPHGNLLSAWNPELHHCAWAGVACNSRSEVVSIRIHGGGGRGSSEGARLKRVCSGWGRRGKLVGKLSPLIGKLSKLRVLSLPFNDLGGEIPSEIWGLKELEVLDLQGNLFTGEYSGQFGVGLTKLRVLNPDSEETASSTSAASHGLSPIEIASIVSASAIVSVLIVLVVLFFYMRKWTPNARVQVSEPKEIIEFVPIGVPLLYEDIVQATGNFNTRNCIGNGGFGATYKAEIAPGTLVAVKRLSVGRFQGFQQFHAEIKALGRVRHPHLVTLIGFHASETEMFLIYNYLPGGNLESFIRGRSAATVQWKILHKIAFHIARALAYLHDQCAPRILHRDVKPSNILLDDEFNAYLSDFGLARLLGTSETHATTGVAGTFGYVAPEYAMTCRVSEKADVYSYGVVLLELMSDKKALDPSFSSQENGFNIVSWASLLLRHGRAKEVFTAGLWESSPHDDLVEMLHLAITCTDDTLSTRPTMKSVVQRLRQIRPS